MKIRSNVQTVDGALTSHYVASIDPTRTNGELIALKASVPRGGEDR